MDYIYSKLKKDDIRNRLEEASIKAINSSFGMFFVLKEGDVSIYSISPSSADTIGVSIPIESGKFDAYELRLENPAFLPLNDNAIKGLSFKLSNLSKFLLPNEKVVIQLAARRLRGNKWRENLFGMYSSYLKGNETPFALSLIRGIQEKTIGLLGSLGNFELNKEYIPEVEDKILDTCYEFKMLLGVISRSPCEIVERLVDTLDTYSSYNSLKPHRITQDTQNNTFQIRSGLISNNSRNVLSRKELFTLLVGNECIDNQRIEKSTRVEDVDMSEFDFLPRNLQQQKMMNEMDKISLMSSIAMSLKDVGIVSVARLYNESVVEGVRLIVAQFDIPKGNNFSHLQKKQKDIQVALGVNSLSIEQGDNPGTVKFVLPNDKPSVVGLREVIELDSFKKFSRKSKLSFIVGVDETSSPIYLSLTKLVHLLVAGTTGSGKSVFINTLVTTLISTHPPEKLQMIMIDPKMVELQQYEVFPHVRSVITVTNEAEKALRDLVMEMEKRYEIFQKIGVKNIELHNESSKKDGIMPYLVCIIDEYADLKDTNPDVEGYIGRLGQKARASGIHMVIATQRPDSKVISGRIKAVIPNAISFNLNNNNDYRTVFGSGIGNVTLLGRGDGIMKIEGHEKHLRRFQSCILSPNESEEREIYRKLSNKFRSKEKADEEYIEETTVDEKYGEIVEKSQLDELKKIIARTKETRVTALRKDLGVRAETMSELMQDLVDEGWMKRHENRSKGYELVVDEGELDKWR